MRLTAITALLLGGVISIGLGAVLQLQRGGSASAVQLVAFDVQHDDQFRHLHVMWNDGDYLSVPDIARPETALPPALEGFYNPSFAPNNQRLVAQGFSENSVSYLYDIDLHSQRAERLPSPPNSTSPKVSPNGEWVAFTVEGSSIQLWVMRRDGSDARQLTFEGDRNMTPAWFPDSEHLVFSRLHNDRLNLYRINIHTHALTQLTDNDVVEGWPAVSPDGEWIAFSARDDRSYHLTLTRSDGSQRHTLTTGQRIDRFPAWSANSQTIYFASQQETSDLYRIQRDGSGLTRLTTTPGADAAPTLSAVLDMPYTAGLPLAVGVSLLLGGGAWLRWRDSGAAA